MPMVRLGRAVLILGKELQYDIPFVAGCLRPSVGYLTAAFVINKNDRFSVDVSPRLVPGKPLLQIIQIRLELTDRHVPKTLLFMIDSPFHWTVQRFCSIHKIQDSWTIESLIWTPPRDNRNVNIGIIQSSYMISLNVGVAVCILAQCWSVKHVFPVDGPCFRIPCIIKRTAQRISETAIWRSCVHTSRYSNDPKWDVTMSHVCLTAVVDD
mmetsp:Transcript_33113/g.49013  ORF Transcript_33113/g.49013 Transcript_33113/m.49013 type:complete len:210 (+) Transcript_33113:434-1063(+)